MTQAQVTTLAQAAVDAKTAWKIAKVDLEKARSDYEHAEKGVILAVKRFYIEFERHGGPEVLDKEIWDEIHAVRFLGLPIGEACRWVLDAFGSATTEELVDYLAQGGFQFRTAVQAREVHAALLKQPWVKKDRKSGRWERHVYFEEGWGKDDSRG